VNKFNILYRSVILIVFLTGLSYSQTKSNLELVNSLIDSSAGSITDKISESENSYSVSFNSADEYVYLQNRLIAQLSSNGSINIDSLNSRHIIKYNLDYAGIKYSDTFKDGLFGQFMLKRTAEIKGNFQIADNMSISHSEMIEYSVVDTIGYDDLEFVEQAGLPFTQAPLPPEPFLPTLVEPLIAISAVVITVILFFTVRTQ
jgi:hypothetical protein